MYARSIPRLLLVGLMVVVIGGGVVSAPAAASPAMEWSDTVGEEDVLVQPCVGFDITSNYTANRMFHADYDNRQIVERQQVTFVGTLENATSGQINAYEGRFTRTGSPDLDQATMSDLALRLDLNTSGEVTVTLALVEFDSAVSPPAVIQTLISNVLRIDLCNLLGGPAISDNDVMPAQRFESESCDVEPRIGFTC
jgi:hypothetical protein